MMAVVNIVGKSKTEVLDTIAWCAARNIWFSIQRQSAVDDERRYGHHCLRCGYERYNSKGNGPEVSNKDWEDISQDRSYFYIGDFGNNALETEKTHILRVEKIACR
jgi:hypothetical protein